MSAKNSFGLPLVAAFAISLCWPAVSAENEFTLTIRDHRFKPEILTVPANQEIALIVINADATAEEFESNDFHVEKVIAGGKQMTFHIGPLTPGEYGFFGDRHPDETVGKLFAE